MSLEIKTTAIQQRRQTFANVARRLGADRPASRYEESMYDLQPEVNFHYRPTWAPEYELFDKARTAITMADWYAPRDPRQLYYGAYTIARSRMMEATEKNFAFVEKRQLLTAIAPAWAEMVRLYLLPLRHYEWGANMNNSQITAIGYGAAITQATQFITMDRLGIAQIISRVGLVMDGNAGDSLAAAKRAWMDDPVWQGVRRMVEDSLVVTDWFELLVAQNLSMDGILYPLVYGRFDAGGQAHGGQGLSMLTEFMVDWQDDNAKWVDAVIKRVAAENDANRQRLSDWYATWATRAQEALLPLADHVLGCDGATALADIRQALDARTRKIGLLV